MRIICTLGNNYHVGYNLILTRISNEIKNRYNEYASVFCLFVFRISSRVKILQNERKKEGGGEGAGEKQKRGRRAQRRWKKL